MANIKAATHMIFDMDGLLLDSEAVYTKIMESICQEHGKQFSWDIKIKQMGKKMEEAGKVLIAELQLPISVDDYCQKVKTKYEELMPLCELLPGVERLIRHLHTHSVPMAIATGSDRIGLETKTRNHQELFSLFNHIVLSTDDAEVKRGKPAPDCFLVAAKRFPDSPDPASCLVFEDAPNGVDAALEAKMQVVWVPDRNMDQTADNRNKRVTLLLQSLADFKPELFGLPPFPE